MPKARTTIPGPTGIKRILIRQEQADGEMRTDEERQKVIDAIRAGDKAEAAKIGIPDEVVDRYMAELQQRAIERSLPSLAPTPVEPLKARLVALLDEWDRQRSELAAIISEL